MYRIEIADTHAPGAELPALIEAPHAGADPVSWAAGHGTWLDNALVAHGALLLRGFGFASTEVFDAFLNATGCRRLEYTYRSTTRQTRGDRIYTATEYSPSATIAMHSENAYQSDWPTKLFFFCKNPAPVGGETPVASNVRVATSLPPDVPARFGRLGLLYVRNYPDAAADASRNVDLTWQAVFQTESREQVEDYCAANGLEFEWKAGGGLRTRQKNRALSVHPRTGRLIWFNQAHIMHVSNMEPEQERALREIYPEFELPRNCYFGDGSPIDRRILDLVREAYIQHRCVFTWQAGDVMVVDNMLVAHGRLPYSGPREVLLAMTDSYRSLQQRVA